MCTIHKHIKGTVYIGELLLSLCLVHFRVGDDARVSLLVLKACSKDLGFYRCTLVSALGSVSTSDYHLTSEGERLFSPEFKDLIQS